MNRSIVLSVFITYIPIPICDKVVSFISGRNIGVFFRCVLHILHTHKQQNKCVILILFLYAHDDVAHFSHFLKYKHLSPV